MTRVLKTSGFLGLAVAMGVGLYLNYLFAVNQPVPFWLTDGHDQLVVLSLVAVVTGVAIEWLRITGRLRRIVTSLVLAGQWFLPIVSWVGFGTGEEIVPVLATTVVWLLCLIVAMLLMAWRAVVTETVGQVPPRGDSAQIFKRDVDSSQEQSQTDS